MYIVFLATREEKRMFNDFIKAALREPPLALRHEVQKLATQITPESESRKEFVEMLIQTAEGLTSQYNKSFAIEKDDNPRKTAGIAYKAAYCLESAFHLSAPNSEQRERARELFPDAADSVMEIEETQPNYTHPIKITFDLV